MFKVLRENYLIIFIMFLILWFYIWTVTAGRYEFPTDGYNYFSLMAESFLSGKLYFINYHAFDDISRFEGKDYLYFAPSAIVTLYLPYLLLTKSYLSDRIAILVFTYGAFIWSACILIYIKNKYFSKCSQWMLFISLAVIGFANVSPFLLSLHKQWELSIACGLFYLTGSIFWFCYSFKPLKPSLKRITLGSLFFGLAIGGRPNLIFAGIIFPVILYKIWKNDYFKTIKEKIYMLIALFAPFVFCLIFLFAYNYFRFGNIFEFGLSYQLIGIPHRLVFFDFKSLPINFYLYLFQIHKVSDTFPYFFLKWHNIPNQYSSLVPYFNSETTFGMLNSVPYILLIFLSPVFYCVENLLIYKEKLLKDNLFLLSLIKTALFLFVILITIKLFNNSTIVKYLFFLPFDNDLIKIEPLLLYIAIFFVIQIAFSIKNKEKTNLTLNQPPTFPKIDFFITLFAGFSVLFFLMLSRGATTRYIADFINYFILASSIVWFYFDCLFTNKGLGKYGSRAIAIIFCFLSIIYGIAYSIHAGCEQLKNENLQGFKKIESIINPIIEKFTLKNSSF